MKDPILNKGVPLIVFFQNKQLQKEAKSSLILDDQTLIQRAKVNKQLYKAKREQGIATPLLEGTIMEYLEKSSMCSVTDSEILTMSSFGNESMLFEKERENQR